MREAVSALFLLLLVSASDAKISKPNLQNFLQCLRNWTSTKEYPITEALYTPDNSTFVSSYVSYTNNKRCSNPNDTNLIAIVAAKHESHVQTTVVCAKSNGIQIRIRSGGHDYDGLSYTSSVPFVVLDMHNFRSITVDVSSKKAWVQAGANLGELYTKIAEASNTLAFPAGVCPTLGAGGHISGGGYGNLMRKYGISVDHVVDAQLVDANGEILNRTTMGEDLFWAIRGGGGASFGVILSWTINLVDVPEALTVFKVNKTLEQGATDVLYKWQLVSSILPEKLFLRAKPTVSNGEKSSDKTIAVNFYAQFLGSATELMAIINKNLPELGIKHEDCYEMSWLDTATFWMDFPVGTPASVLLNETCGPPTVFYKSKSDYVKKLIPKEGIEKIWEAMLKFNNMYMEWSPYGGVMDRIPSNAIAFPHRKGNLFKVQYFALWTDENATDAHLDLMKELYNVAEPYVSSNPREAFLNYRDIDIGSNPSTETSVEVAKIYGSKYFLGNLKRLMDVKAKHDPDNFFRYEQSIPPVRAVLMCDSKCSV